MTTSEITATVPTVVVEPSRGMSSLQLLEVWKFRELLYFLTWRDVKVRYKQTVLGVLWVVLQPLVTVVVFSVLFGGLLNVPSGDIPYPAFAYAAILPWNYFAGSLSRSSMSLVTSSNLLTKVYFPRLVIPISSVLAGLPDFLIGLVVFIGLLAYFGLPLGVTAALVPLLTLLTLLTALGFGLWLSALNVRFRDINYIVPYLVQVWMFVTPVIYGASLIPERFQFLLALNPMTAMVQGFRYALLGDSVTYGQLTPQAFGISIAVTAVVFVGGLIFFRSTERTFADIV